MIQATLIDSMGDDLRVANAARVSFDKESSWDETFQCSLGCTAFTGICEAHGGFMECPGGFSGHKLSERDQKLISYLARHNHWTPFSHVQITLREEVPIFVARQRFKHMVGFTYNEVSRRYVDDEPTFYVPEVWRAKAENVKQGSGGEFTGYVYTEDQEGVDTGPEKLLANHHEDCLYLYSRMIERGIAPEQARMVLPQSMMTSYYTTGSLAAFARAYKQRSDTHSQKEIRDLAAQWDQIIRPLFPVSWAALVS